MSWRRTAVDLPGVRPMGLEEMGQGRDVPVEGSEGQQIDHVPGAEIRRLYPALALELFQLPAARCDFVPALPA